jgi:iron complex transport system permease protein
MRRAVPVTIALSAATLGSFFLSVLISPYRRFLAAGLFSPDGGIPESAAAGTAERIVLSLRLPRALLGCLVGGALSSSGVAFQALLRNPLADPYILGVSAGAAVGALIVALLLPPDTFLLLPFCAFLGAALAASVVFLLARRRTGVSRERLILMGVIVGAFLNALIMLMLSLAPPAGSRARSTG